MADELNTDDAKETKASKKSKGKTKGGSKLSGSNLVPAVIVAAGLVVGGKFVAGSKNATPAQAAPAAAAAATDAKGTPTNAAGEPDCKAYDFKNEPKKGGVAALESMTINLADGHYAKVTIALQLPETVKLEEFEKMGKTAIAADQVNKVIAGREVTDFATPQSMGELKKKLDAEIRPAYECEVLEVLVTNFVTQ
jgi:flagellar basal body-associated protein FliL